MGSESSLVVMSGPADPKIPKIGFLKVKIQIIGFLKGQEGVLTGVLRGVLRTSVSTPVRTLSEHPLGPSRPL